MSLFRDLWDSLMWEPRYGECFGHSTRHDSVPADYEVWFTTFGDMVTEQNPPESCCHTLCVECTALARAENTPGNPGGMEIVMMRLVRS